MWVTATLMLTVTVRWTVLWAFCGVLWCFVVFCMACSFFKTTTMLAVLLYAVAAPLLILVSRLSQNFRVFEGLSLCMAGVVVAVVRMLYA